MQTNDIVIYLKHERRDKMEFKGLKHDAYLQILINKEFKKEVQKIALENDETVSEVIRRALEDYIKKHRKNSNTPQEDKPRKKLAKKKQSA